MTAARPDKPQYSPAGRLTGLAGSVALLAAGQFIAVAAVTIARFPGGSDFDPDAPGYSFWRNTLSDLGQRATPGGGVNHLAPLFGLSLAGVFVGIALLFWALPALLTDRLRPRGPGTIIRLLGAASAAGGAGVGASLAADWETGHIAGIGAAAVTGLAALLVTCVALARSARTGLAILTAALLLVGLWHFRQYVNHFWLGGSWPPAAPATQKLAVLTALGWMIALGAALRRRNEPDRATPH